MTCEEIIEFLLGYLDGELAPHEQEQFEEHLAECPTCVAYLESYRATIRLTHLSQDEVVRSTLDSMPEDLLKAILNARKKSAS
jgi:anti-sigma factor RsiW